MGYGQMTREMRERKGWTQRQLADAVGCTDGYVAHIENELKLPSLDITLAVARALGMSAEEEQRLVESVEDVRRRRSEQRIRTRGIAVRGALRTRGGAFRASAEPEKIDEETIARDLRDDPDLKDAYENLKKALDDPRMRDTVLTTLRAFARDSD